MCLCVCLCVCGCVYICVCVCVCVCLCTEKVSPVYIFQNDKPMTGLALSTAHQVNTNLCQPHSLKGCHIFVIDLSKTCPHQFLFLL